MKHKFVNGVMQFITCDPFSNSFNFHLQLLNSVRVGEVQTIFDGIQVRWTWRPGSQTIEALLKSIRKDLAVKHILQDVKNGIICM